MCRNMKLQIKKLLTAVTNLMAHNCSSLTFSTKKGVIPIDDTYEWKKTILSTFDRQTDIHSILQAGYSLNGCYSITCYFILFAN